LNVFVLNLLLAFAWVLGTGNFSALNFAFGFLLGYFILYFTQRALGKSRYFGRGLRTLRFIIFYLYEIIAANLRVAYEVITSSNHARPGIVAIPLDAETDTEIMLLVIFVAMTPGTLCLDISDDRKVLYLYTMYVHDVESFRREIKDGFERQILEVLR
jgi:multicomponent Na+:H+ antiporter subunit E